MASPWCLAFDRLLVMITLIVGERAHYLSMILWEKTRVRNFFFT